jgi:hypothetical protein
MPTSSPCPALISLVHLQHPRQHHWWLAESGDPQRIAGLLGSALRGSGRGACHLDELLQVFDPLPALGSAEANPAGRQASYRYQIQLRPGGADLSCWRRYPEGIGWQRRCGPMPLALFVRRFHAPALAVHPADPIGRELLGADHHSFHVTATAAEAISSRGQPSVPPSTERRDASALKTQAGWSRSQCRG